MIDMKAIVSEIIDKRKTSLNKQLNELDNIANEIKNGQWKHPRPMMKSERTWFPGIASASGIYMIVHFVPGETEFNIFYIGKSKKIGSRRSKHVNVFKNDGQPLNYFTNGSDSGATSHADSVIGRKMYNKDPDPDHWFFTYFEIDPDWIDVIEDCLIYKLMPEGNDVKMSGI